jgi:DNA repair exonuclease SbcCD ATPase subunit
MPTRKSARHRIALLTIVLPWVWGCEQNNERVARMQQENAVLAARIAELEATQRELTTDLEKARIDKAATDSSFEGCKADLTQAQQTAKDLREELTRIRLETTEAQAAVTRATDLAEKLEKANTAAQQTATRARSEANAAKARAEALKAENDELRRTLKQTQDILDELIEDEGSEDDTEKKDEEAP